MTTSSSDTSSSPPSPELTAEEREIVERGLALLKSLEGKPYVSPGLQSRAGDGLWNEAEKAAAGEKDPNADKPLI